MRLVYFQPLMRELARLRCLDSTPFDSASLSSQSIWHFWPCSTSLRTHQRSSWSNSVILKCCMLVIMAYCCLELPSAVFELVLTRYRYWSIFRTYSTPPTSLVWLPLSLMALQAPWPQKACDSRAEFCLLRLRRIDYCEHPSCFYLRFLASLIFRWQVDWYPPCSWKF